MDDSCNDCRQDEAISPRAVGLADTPDGSRPAWIVNTVAFPAWITTLGTVTSPHLSTTAVPLAPVEVVHLHSVARR